MATAPSLKMQKPEAASRMAWCRPPEMLTACWALPLCTCCAASTVPPPASGRLSGVARSGRSAAASPVDCGRHGGIPVNDLIDTTEMYLRTVFELEEEGIVPLRARIAERLHQSGPTVSQTVARMERDGLIKVEGDRHLELTDVGRKQAVRVMRKHRLAERLLVDVIGLEWEDVHEEACRWEHVMSEAVERKLVKLLDHPTTSPYGNPIPGLDKLGDGEPAPPAEADLARLDEF